MAKIISNGLNSPLLLVCAIILLFCKSWASSSQVRVNSSSNNSAPTPTATPKPNYLETGRQITGILDRFMSLGYDKRVRPNYGGAPVEVNVTMRILSISSVSEVMMDFTADFYFRQTWHDPRLAFKKLGDIHTLYVGAEVSKKIWLPDTFFGNEKMAYFHEATTPNVFLRIDHSGEVYRSIRLTVTSSCPMNLQYFPMDRQRCTIEAESYGYNIKDIIYKWARKDTAVERDEGISLPQFDIVKTVQKYRLEELSSGTYSRLIAEIHFSRRMGYYLIQIYIPSSLIVVISWVSFWLHRNASPARVQLGVTTVLTMTTLMSSTNAALPKISYIKSIDIFLGTCFIMVFAALLEYATVGYLGKRIAMRKAHAQHAQSQAQARLFAELQAQGAQGDLVAPSSSSNLFSGAADQQSGSPFTLAHAGVDLTQPTPLLPPPPSLASFVGTPLPPPRSPAKAGCCCARSCKTLPRNISFADRRPDSHCACPHSSHAHHLSHHHHHHHHQQQQQTHSQNCNCRHTNHQPHSCRDLEARTQHQQATEWPSSCLHSVHQPADQSQAAGCCQHQQTAPESSKSAAALAAAAQFVNLHRKTKGLPPSTNPNFRQFSQRPASGYTRSLETIFGVRPSDIDKYSRVVFPVCFVCFQLMYWVVYLHISAFLNDGQQQPGGGLPLPLVPLAQLTTPSSASTMPTA